MVRHGRHRRLVLARVSLINENFETTITMIICARAPTPPTGVFEKHSRDQKEHVHPNEALRLSLRHNVMLTTRKRHGKGGELRGGNQVCSAVLQDLVITCDENQPQPIIRVRPGLTQGFLVAKPGARQRARLGGK